MSTDIMIDMETLGTTADAVILSIGAVRFNKELPAGQIANLRTCLGESELPERFYRVISLGSQPARDISRRTLEWWTRQSPEAAAVLTHQPKTPLPVALDDLCLWIQTGPQVDNVWSNGADFDLPMLIHAYAKADRNLPWGAYTSRCYRTYKNLPGARSIKVERMGEHHNALDDAIYQAQHLCAIHAALFGKTQGGAA